MARILVSLRQAGEALWFEARYYGAWAFFFPEFALKALYFLPAFVFGQAPGGALTSFFELCWQRYQYVWMHHAAGLMLENPGLRDEMEEARQRCRQWINEIDEAFDMLYES